MHAPHAAVRAERRSAANRPRPTEATRPRLPVHHLLGLACRPACTATLGRLQSVWEQVGDARSPVSRLGLVARRVLPRMHPAAKGGRYSLLQVARGPIRRGPSREQRRARALSVPARPVRTMLQEGCLWRCLRFRVPVTAGITSCKQLCPGWLCSGRLPQVVQQTPWHAGCCGFACIMHLHGRQGWGLWTCRTHDLCGSAVRMGVHQRASGWWRR